MFKTAELCDRFHENVRVFSPVLSSFGGVQSCIGIAVTIKCTGNNLGIAQLVNEGGKDRILIVDDINKDHELALLNYEIVNQMVMNNWHGIIINGYVRNSALLKQLPIVIRALGVVPKGSQGKGKFSLYEPLTFANQRIISGDKIVIDEDGIIILNEENF